MLLWGLMASGECATVHWGACRSSPVFADCAVSDVCGLAPLTGHCALPLSALKESFLSFSPVAAAEVLVKNGKRMFEASTDGKNGELIV